MNPRSLLLAAAVVVDVAAGAVARAAVGAAVAARQVVARLLHGAADARRCMSLLVDISESMWWPLKMSVSDRPMTKNPTQRIETSTMIIQAGMA